MQNSMNDNFKYAIRIIAELNERGLPAFIAGGYARDMFFGKNPKDIDIVVAIGSNGTNYSAWYCERVIPWILKDIQYKLYGNYGNPPKSKFLTMYNTVSSDRCLGVSKIPDFNIDVIFYKDCNNIQDMVNAFDFNLNQFVMMDDPNYTSPYDKSPVFMGNTDLRTLQRVRDDTNILRDVKISKKHQELLPSIYFAYSSGKLV